MAKFCTKCGNPLDENGKCNCTQKEIANKVKQAFGKNADQINHLERDQSIVPQNISADDGEIPIKQYKFARLRSKIRGQYAEGRLQVTNKRLLFRAAGISTTGKTTLQQEFNITEIAGVDIKKGNKISVLNVIGSIILSFILSVWLQDIFETLHFKAEFLSSLLAIVLFAICVLVFFAIPKKFWAKLAVISCGIGALLGSSASSLSALSIVLGFELFTFKNILVFILAIGWFVTLLQVCFVPDLTFTIKASGAGEAIQIRRKIWGFFIKQPQEYTGFSEVMPWEDTDKAIGELGAIINDIQTMGDMAIDKWKEN